MKKVSILVCLGLVIGVKAMHVDPAYLENKTGVPITFTIVRKTEHSPMLGLPEEDSKSISSEKINLTIGERKLLPGGMIHFSEFGTLVEKEGIKIEDKSEKPTIDPKVFPKSTFPISGTIKIIARDGTFALEN